MRIILRVAALAIFVVMFVLVLVFWGRSFFVADIFSFRNPGGHVYGLAISRGSGIACYAPDPSIPSQKIVSPYLSHHTMPPYRFDRPKKSLPDFWGDPFQMSWRLSSREISEVTVVPWEKLWTWGDELRLDRTWTLTSGIRHRDQIAAYLLMIPCWLPCFIMSLYLLVLGFRLRRRVAIEQKKYRVGRCDQCGYDLRATLERCPECGTQREHQ